MPPRKTTERGTGESLQTEWPSIRYRPSAVAKPAKRR